MIYLFRIRPVARFLLACFLGWMGWTMFSASNVTHGALAVRGAPGVLLAVLGIVLMALAVLILPHLGRISRAYARTWKWR